MILESVLGSPPRDWVAIARKHLENVAREFSNTMERIYPAKAGEAKPLADYEGRYTHIASGDIEIVRSSNGLLSDSSTEGCGIWL